MFTFFRTISLSVTAFAAFFLFGASTFAKNISFSFKDKPVLEVIESYSKAAQQKFVVDSSVTGNTSILSQGPISLEEAFELLTAALAIEGYAVGEKSGTFYVVPARIAQRSYPKVITGNLPPEKPQQMVSWIATLKHLTADDVIKRMRILHSRHGEMSRLTDKKVIFTDWITNIHRIKKILEAADVEGNS